MIINSYVTKFIYSLYILFTVILEYALSTYKKKVF